MTTIAWRFPFMASDGRVTIENLIYTEKCTKIYKLSSGGLMGFSGAWDSRPIIKLFDTVKTSKGFPDPKIISDCHIDFRAILVLLNGTSYVVESGPDYTDEDGNKHKDIWQASIMELNEPHVAVGSGSRWAKAAMDCGKTAEQAVRIAMKNDAVSGGKVQVFELTNNKKKVIK